MTKNYKTNITATFNVLDSHYYDNESRTIDANYLRESISMAFDNTKAIITEITNKRRSVRSLVWMAFIELVNMDLCPDGLQATSYQLKKWLASHNLDYSVLTPLIVEYEDYRKECLEYE